MNTQEIKKIIEIFDASNSVKLKITNDNFEISLEKSNAKPHKIQTQQPVIESVAMPNIVESTSTNVEAGKQTENKTSVETFTIYSPMVGTFYRAPSPDSAPYVNVGDKVKKGQTVAIIEAMKIMNEIEADFDCKIIEIIPSDAKSVEYNAPLFIVEKI